MFYEPYGKSKRLRRFHHTYKIVLTSTEKRFLSGERSSASNLDCVDFSGADLRGARFEGTSLIGCDFSRADLRGTVFLDCDLRSARFDRSLFADNCFKRSWLTGAEGITRSLFGYIRVRGGHFAYC